MQMGNSFRPLDADGNQQRARPYLISDRAAVKLISLAPSAGERAGVMGRCAGTFMAADFPSSNFSIIAPSPNSPTLELLPVFPLSCPP